MKVLDTNRHEKAGQTGQVFSLFRPSHLPVKRHAPRLRLWLFVNTAAVISSN